LGNYVSKITTERKNHIFLVSFIFFFYIVKDTFLYTLSKAMSQTSRGASAAHSSDIIQVHNDLLRRINFSTGGGSATLTSSQVQALAMLNHAITTSVQNDYSIPVNQRNFYNLLGSDAEWNTYISNLDSNPSQTLFNMVSSGTSSGSASSGSSGLTLEQLIGTFTLSVDQNGELSNITGLLGSSEELLVYRDLIINSSGSVTGGKSIIGQLNQLTAAVGLSYPSYFCAEEASNIQGAMLGGTLVGDNLLAHPHSVSPTEFIFTVDHPTDSSILYLTSITVTGQHSDCTLAYTTGTSKYFSKTSTLWEGHYRNIQNVYGAGTPVSNSELYVVKLVVTPTPITLIEMIGQGGASMVANGSNIMTRLQALESSPTSSGVTEQQLIAFLFGNYDPENYQGILGTVEQVNSNHSILSRIINLEQSGGSSNGGLTAEEVQGLLAGALIGSYDPENGLGLLGTEGQLNEHAVLTRIATLEGNTNLPSSWSFQGGITSLLFGDDGVIGTEAQLNSSTQSILTRLTYLESNSGGGVTIQDVLNILVGSYSISEEAATGLLGTEGQFTSSSVLSRLENVESSVQLLNSGLTSQQVQDLVSGVLIGSYDPNNGQGLLGTAEQFNTHSILSRIATLESSSGGTTAVTANSIMTALDASNHNGYYLRATTTTPFYTWDSMALQGNMTGHIIPTSNAEYDFGSAENKIRHLFLSDNSLWVGDTNKITIGTDGLLKLRKIDTTRIPKAVTDLELSFAMDASAGSAQDYLEYVKGVMAANTPPITINTISDMTPSRWVVYTQRLLQANNDVSQSYSVDDLYGETANTVDASGNSLYVESAANVTKQMLTDEIGPLSARVEQVEGDINTLQSNSGGSGSSGNSGTVISNPVRTITDSTTLSYSSAPFLLGIVSNGPTVTITDVPSATELRFQLRFQGSGSYTVVINGISCSITTQLAMLTYYQNADGSEYILAIGDDNSSTIIQPIAPDTTPPVIVLNGAANVDIEQTNGTYTDPGATATDDRDGDVSANIAVSGDVVNLSSVGTYVITYNVSDSAGNQAVQVTRTVNVYQNATSPVVTLTGDNTVNHPVKTAYTDAGATATDDLDGDLTSQIQFKHKYKKVTAPNYESDGTSSVTDAETLAYKNSNFYFYDNSGNKQVLKIDETQEGGAPNVPSQQFPNFPFLISESSTNMLQIAFPGAIRDAAAELVAGIFGVNADAWKSANGNAANWQILIGAQLRQASGNVNPLGKGPDSAHGMIRGIKSTDLGLNTIAGGAYAVYGAGALIAITDIPWKDRFQYLVGNLAAIAGTSSLPEDAPPFTGAQLEAATTDPNTGVSSMPLSGYDNFGFEWYLGFLGLARLPNRIYAPGYDSSIVCPVELRDPYFTFTNPQTQESMPQYNPQTEQWTSPFSNDIYVMRFAAQNRHPTVNINPENNVDTNTVGTYGITYQVSDAAGNVSNPVSRTINVTDTVIPVITLTGAASVSIEQNATGYSLDGVTYVSGGSYNDPGATASDNYDNGVTVVTGGDTVILASVGSYTITYNATDSSNNAAAQKTRTVNVEAPSDTTSPSVQSGSITFEGTLLEIIFTESIANWNTADWSVTHSTLQLSNPQWTNSNKTLTLTLSAPIYDSDGQQSFTLQGFEDEAGNSAVQTLNVTPTWPAPDTTAPVITLTGAASVSIEQNATDYSLDGITYVSGGNYVDPGATATDNVDNSVNVVTGGDTVDLSTPNVYTITYNATDSSNNTAVQITRTVTVEAPTQAADVFVSATVEHITPETITIQLTEGGSYSLEHLFTTVDANTQFLLSGNGTLGTSTTAFDYTTPSFIDDSGNNHNITGYGDPRHSKFGKFGTSVQFFQNDNQDYLQCDNALDWHTSAAQDFTIECWAYLASVTDDWKCAVGINGNDGTNVVLLGQQDNLSIEGNDVYSTGSSSHRLGEWVHYALVQENSTIRFYVNGAMKYTGSGIQRSLADCHMYIGAESDSAEQTIGNLWKGYIEGVRVSSVARYTGTSDTEWSNINPPFNEFIVKVNEFGGYDTKTVTSAKLQGSTLSVSVNDAITYEHGGSINVTFSGNNSIGAFSEKFVTNNTVEPWIALTVGSVAVNYPRVVRETKRALRHWEAILDPRRITGLVPHEQYANLSNFTCAVDFDIDSTSDTTIAWAGARSWASTALDSSVHNGTWTYDNSSGKGYLELVPYEGRYEWDQQSNGENLYFKITRYSATDMRCFIANAYNPDTSSFSGYTYFYDPNDTSGNGFPVFKYSSDGGATLSNTYTLKFTNTTTAIYDGSTTLNLLTPLRATSGFEFPTTGQTRYGYAFQDYYDEFVFDTQLHEIGHILGITSQQWKRQIPHRNAAGITDQDSYDAYQDGYLPSYLGERANAFYKTVLQGNQTHIPIEQDMGAGSAGSHWDESHFENEMLSTSGTRSVDEHLTGITIGALEDQGWPIRSGSHRGYALSESAYSLPSGSTAIAVAARQQARVAHQGGHHCCDPPSAYCTETELPIESKRRQTSGNSLLNLNRFI
jgi:hypothetical protein